MESQSLAGAPVAAGALRPQVFALWHVHEFDDGSEDLKFIGCFTSRENAESARSLLVLQPGFRDTPDGFEIASYRLDEFGWKEGFVSVEDDD